MNADRSFSDWTSPSSSLIANVSVKIGWTSTVNRIIKLFISKFSGCFYQLDFSK